MGSLTQKQRSIIIGTLLGDGYLRKMPGRKDAFLEVNHSISAKDYVEWKYSQLKNISVGKPKERKGNGRRIAYRFYTSQHPELSEIYNQFYKNGKKIVPDVELDSIILAIWFMDDGSKCRAHDVYLNTQQFSEADQRKLLNMLQKVGLQVSLNRDKTYYRLRFLKESVQKFNKIIAQHIIPSMRYKLSYDPVETRP